MTENNDSNTTETEQTVFVIDDDVAVRESIKALVDIRGKRVETFASGEAFLEFYTQEAPGCVVTDLRIDPGMSGIELQVELSKRGFKIPVIVISAYANVSSAVQAMHNGAITLLEKNCSTDELWKNIAEALQLDEELRAAREKVDALMKRFTTLSPEEIGVMKRIIDGTLNKNIAKDLSISLRTVESRRHNVLEKVGVGSVQELVRIYVELEQAIGAPPEKKLLEAAGFST
jgi:two-component system, LuxR family, response regulator FixJ